MSNKRPTRLHHHAVVVKDLKATRDFYTGILGLPMVALWSEETANGQKYCHAFFELEDGGCLAFFQFADEADYQAYRRPDKLSTFHHIALSGTKAYQDAVAQRAQDNNIVSQSHGHGYCHSFYAYDPDSHVVEITVDCDEPEVVERIKEIQSDPEAELKRWLAGDHRTNNKVRVDLITGV